MSRYGDDNTPWYEGPQRIDRGPRAEDLPEPIPNLRERIDEAKRLREETFKRAVQREFERRTA